MARLKLQLIKLMHYSGQRLRRLESVSRGRHLYNAKDAARRARNLKRLPQARTAKDRQEFYQISRRFVARMSSTDFRCGMSSDKHGITHDIHDGTILCYRLPSNELKGKHDAGQVNGLICILPRQNTLAGRWWKVLAGDPVTKPAHPPQVL